MSDEKVIEKYPALSHPYMEKLQGTLNTHEELLDCLEKRLALIGTDAANQTDYDLNENKILRIKTLGEIDSLKKIIKAKKDYFIKYMHQFVRDMELMEKQYDSLLHKAQQKANKNDELRDLLYSVRWDIVDTNVEVKLILFKRLKKILG